MLPQVEAVNGKAPSTLFTIVSGIGDDATIQHIRTYVSLDFIQEVLSDEEYDAIRLKMGFPDRKNKEELKRNLLNFFNGKEPDKDA